MVLTPNGSYQTQVQELKGNIRVFCRVREVRIISYPRRQVSAPVTFDGLGFSGLRLVGLRLGFPNSAAFTGQKGPRGGGCTFPGGDLRSGQFHDENVRL